MPTMPAEVLQEIAWSTNDDVMNRRDATPIDRSDMPWLEKLDSRKKVSGQAGGQTTVKLTKNGGLDIQFWERRDTLGFGESHVDLELSFPFVNVHLGMELVHDDLSDQGYEITPNGPRSRSSFKKMSEDEVNTLVDIVEVKVDDMYDTWDVKCDVAFLRDGSYDTKAIVGLDGLVNTTPTTGTIGGKARSNPLLQHTVYTDLSSAALGSGGNIRQRLTAARRAADNSARGRGNMGRVDFLMAGDDFIDGYMSYAERNNWQVQVPVTGVDKLDIAINDEGLRFGKIPIIRNPTFRVLQQLESASIDWNKRCYGLTSKAWHLCHPKGKDRLFSVPLDQSDVRFTRMSIDGRFALVDAVPNANFLVALA